MSENTVCSLDLEKYRWARRSADQDPSKLSLHCPGDMPSPEGSRRTWSRDTHTKQTINTARILGRVGSLYKAVVRRPRVMLQKDAYEPTGLTCQGNHQRTLA